MVRQAGERVATTSADIVAEQVERLRAIFPEAFSDGKVDFDKLKATLGEFVDDRAERYSFGWAGKQAAIRALQTPTWGTLKPDRAASINFDTTKHLFIEGENLEVLKLLYKSYFGRVKMIYIDPPYNTGNDFVYPDDFRNPKAAYLRMTGQVDEEGNYLTSNPETSGRYHSDWLSMMYPRLFLARQLLRDDGVIFVSIDDHEVHNLRLLMNEVFGEENFIAQFIWKKMDSPSRNDENRFISVYHDYVLLYARSQEQVRLHKMAKPEILDAYPLELPDGQLARRRQLRKNGKGARREDRPTMWYPLIAPDGSTVYPIAPEGWEGRWVLSEDTWREREQTGLTDWILRDYGWVPYYVEVAPANPGVPWPTLWDDLDQNRQAKAKFNSLMEGSGLTFDNPKPVDLIERMLRICTNQDDICLDFFSGSCSTAEAILRLNRKDGESRRYIMIQLPEATQTLDGRTTTVTGVGRERLRRVIASLARDHERQFDLENRDEPEDLAFRAFTLVESNWRQWQAMPANTSPEEYAQALELFHDPLVGDWKTEDLIYEVILREGFSLTSRVERIEGLPQGVNVWRVSDDDKAQSFLICLDARFELETARLLNLDQDDLFICRDIALDDTEAANLALQCRLKII